MPDFDGEVRFEFDEAISERNVEGSATIFPFEARPRVRKGKQNVRVRPRAGWVPDRIYHLEIDPVIQDLFNNAIERPIRYVFSTGTPMSDNAVTGTVFDRITGRELRRGRVDLVHLPDTLRYGIEIDSAGSFFLDALPLGDFLAIGYEDLNGNRRADEFDRADTIPVALSSIDTLGLEFHVFKHDTLGPTIFEVNSVDSVVLAIDFDGYLDPAASLSTAAIQVTSEEDSTVIPLDTVLHNWEYPDWEEARIEAARAAARAAADTLAAEIDTLAAEAATPQDTAPAPQPPQPGSEVLDQEVEDEGPEILPARRIYIAARSPIPPGSYQVRVTGMVNLSGLRADSEGTLEQPAPEPEDEEGEQPNQPPRGEAGRAGDG